MEEGEEEDLCAPPYYCGAKPSSANLSANYIVHSAAKRVERGKKQNMKVSQKTRFFSHSLY